MIRPVKIDDAKNIAGIYNHYVRETVITFEERPVSIGEMSARIKAISAKYPWLVMEEDGDVSGYAYANTWKERYAYRYAAELSLYLKTGLEGKGRGTRLMKALLDAVRKTELHALVSGITLPNERSVALHEKFGFVKIAQFNEIGFKLGRRLDVGYWELIPEDR
ncbi:MAG: GNAT family N-acetyltransferase [Treponema sp.]|jgi:phosphinothricin acetyltransferase|nr:GNAT family N-acetyltransferase [Treponema sp.]